MITTNDLLQVIENSELLATYISQSEIAIQYKEAKESLGNDAEAQILIARFVNMKEKYEEVERFGKYHPDFNSITTEMREAKRAVDLHETVAHFKKTEREMEKLLNEVSGIIAHSVSQSIKVPTGNPFFDNRSCQGGCGSGGSCGCN